VRLFKFNRFGMTSHPNTLRFNSDGWTCSQPTNWKGQIIGKFLTIPTTAGHIPASPPRTSSCGHYRGQTFEASGGEIRRVISEKQITEAFHRVGKSGHFCGQLVVVTRVDILWGSSSGTHARWSFGKVRFHLDTLLRFCVGHMRSRQARGQAVETIVWSNCANHFREQWSRSSCFVDNRLWAFSGSNCQSRPWWGQSLWVTTENWLSCHSVDQRGQVLGCCGHSRGHIQGVFFFADTSSLVFW